MPWSVKKIENKFCVVKEGESIPVKGGCHVDRQEAESHVKALYSGEAMSVIIESFNEDEVLEAPAVLDQPFFNSDEETDETKVEEYQWQGPIAFEGVLTGDNRIFKSGAIHWDSESLPWPFRFQRASVGGHTGAVPIGRLDLIERREDGVIYGYGVVIPSLNEEATEYLRLLQSGVAGGVSIDGDSAEFDVQDLGEGKTRIEFSSMRARSLTCVDCPAFHEAQIDLTDDTEELARKKRKQKMDYLYKVTASAEDLTLEDINQIKYLMELDPELETETLLAAAIPCKPSIKCFQELELDGPTPLKVTPEGAVYGHLALFGTCHIGLSGACVTPPKNASYKYFHTGEIETEEGDLVEIGHLTFNTGHASMTANAKDAASHYDHTGTVAADVRVGEDKHGIWVAGALRSTLSDEDIRAFRAAPLSGDWRRIAGKLELVGALAVNVPGFPVPRARSLVASGESQVLIYTEMSEPLGPEAFDPYEEGLRFAKRNSLAARISTTAFAHEDITVPSQQLNGGDVEMNIYSKKLRLEHKVELAQCLGKTNNQ